MPRRVIFQKPSMDADLAVSGLQVLVPPRLSFTVEVEFESKVFGLVEKDHILLKEMNEAIQKVYKQTADGIKNKLRVFDGWGQKLSAAELQKHLPGLNQSIENDKKVAEVASVQAAKGVWEKYKRTKAEYRNYGIKIVVSIAGGVASLVSSIVTMATTPFTGGLSGALAIIGLFKTAVGLAKDIANAAMEVETAQKILNSQLDCVKTIAGEHFPDLRRSLNEYSAVVVNQFLGVAQPNIKSVEEQFKIVTQKLGGIEIKCHDASVTLNEILDKQEDLRADFLKQARDRLCKMPTARSTADMATIEKRLDEQIDKLAGDVRKQIGQVDSIYERWKNGHAAMEQARPRVETLVKMRGTGVKVAEKIVWLLDKMGAPDPDAMAKTAREWQKNASDAATFAYDKFKHAVLEHTALA